MLVMVEVTIDSFEQYILKVPLLDIDLKGTNRKKLICSLSGILVSYNLDFVIRDKGNLEITFHNLNFLLALILKIQREKHKLSIQDVCNLLGWKSKNAYSRYENGTVSIPVSRFSELFYAITGKNLILNLD